MNGRNLTLGIIAGLAVAGLARRASGSGNTPGGRFRKISPTPAGFVTSPLSFVRGTTLELAVDREDPDRDQPGTGLYHVTTNLPAVLAEGRLRSRRELRAAGRQGAGLGGGILDQAPDRVSVGLTLDGALRVLRGTRMMARAVHGQISAAEALEAMKTFSSSSTDMLDRAAEWMLDQEDTDDPAYLDAKSYEDDLVRAGREVLASPPGPDLYSAGRWSWLKRRPHGSRRDTSATTSAPVAPPSVSPNRLTALNAFDRRTWDSSGLRAGRRSGPIRSPQSANCASGPKT